MNPTYLCVESGKFWDVPWEKGEVAEFSEVPSDAMTARISADQVPSEMFRRTKPDDLKNGWIVSWDRWIAQRGGRYLWIKRVDPGAQQHTISPFTITDNERPKTPSVLRIVELTLSGEGEERKFRAKLPLRFKPLVHENAIPHIESAGGVRLSIGADHLLFHTLWRTFNPNEIPIPEGRFRRRLEELGELARELIEPEPAHQSAERTAPGAPSGVSFGNITAGRDVILSGGDMTADRSIVEGEKPSSPPRGKTKDVQAKPSHWVDGGFYLVAFAWIIAVLVVAEAYSSLIAFGFITVVAFLVLELIGLLLALRNGEVKEKGFLQAMKNFNKQLPLLKYFASRRH